MKNEHPEKCVNCGAEVWLGAFFDGFFLCIDCDSRKGEIIFKLKARLARRKHYTQKVSQSVSQSNANLLRWKITPYTRDEP